MQFCYVRTFGGGELRFDDGGDVDGALVGGASLSAAGFVAIARMSMK